MYVILILIGGVVYGIWKIMFEDQVKHNRLIRKALKKGDKLEYLRLTMTHSHAVLIAEKELGVSERTFLNQASATQALNECKMEETYPYDVLCDLARKKGVQLDVPKCLGLIENKEHEHILKLSSYSRHYSHEGLSAFQETLFYIYTGNICDGDPRGWAIEYSDILIKDLKQAQPKKWKKFRNISEMNYDAEKGVFVQQILVLEKDGLFRFVERSSIKDMERLCIPYNDILRDLHEHC